MACWNQAWLRRFAQLVVLCAVSTVAGLHTDSGPAGTARASSTARTVHLFHKQLSWLRLRGGGRAADHGEEESDISGRDPPPWKKTSARVPKAAGKKTTAKDKKKKRESGLDWETFRRKVRDGAPKDNSAYDPYIEGTEGKVWQVRTNDGKNSHAVLVKPPKRGKWTDKKIMERETQASVEAMLANLEEDTVYVGGGPTGELGVAGSGAPLRRHKWERFLFPQLREAVENERKGLQFTGEFEDRGRIAVPVYTDKNYTIQPITGDHVNSSPE